MVMKSEENCGVNHGIDINGDDCVNDNYEVANFMILLFRVLMIMMVVVVVLVPIITMVEVI